jgi:hypothetical protein
MYSTGMKEEGCSASKTTPFLCIDVDNELNKMIEFSGVYRQLYDGDKTHLTHL